MDTQNTPQPPAQPLRYLLYLLTTICKYIAICLAIANLFAPDKPTPGLMPSPPEQVILWAIAAIILAVLAYSIKPPRR